MTISTLIEALESIQKRIGDIEVEVRNPAGDHQVIEEVLVEEDRWGTVVRIES